MMMTAVHARLCCWRFNCCDAFEEGENLMILCASIGGGGGCLGWDGRSKFPVNVGPSLLTTPLFVADRPHHHHYLSVMLVEDLAVFLRKPPPMGSATYVSEALAPESFQNISLIYLCIKYLYFLFFYFFFAPLPKVGFLGEPLYTKYALSRRNEKPHV
ncbi:hypothetical protein FN846DRAFT_641625 [Sphaerosporella brunnea]|uniref:Uncharacterized protein n=1 Tax=Sphaerosporella brunnea TaxID=1250544 RepID=A0A5J5F0B7_9PEZI|nr:hypothetical protein FN846DRAFT_641625 [Sphaerosporella brunnea]